MVGLDRRAKARRGVLLVFVGLGLLALPCVLGVLLAFATNVAPAILGWPAYIAWLIVLFFASAVGVGVLLAGAVAVVTSRFGI